ncbi:hypothetical protein AB0395_11885 [Streptosporangium sp. NPDC051023]|uniref:hypothetical protein n=1 Tax=Streptosporangium sp. NPDC051023 TaxID=3155410 RepID=UPI00344E9712
MKSSKSLAFALLAVAFGTGPTLLLSTPASAASSLESHAGKVAGPRPGRVEHGISWTTHLTMADMRGRKAGGTR